MRDIKKKYKKMLIHSRKFNLQVQRMHLFFRLVSNIVSGK